MTVMEINIRNITVGPIHAAPGDSQKVSLYHRLLVSNPEKNFPPVEVREKPNGTYRIYDGRHRFLAYVLAQRETIPAVLRPEHLYETERREMVILAVMGELSKIHNDMSLSWSQIRSEAEQIVDALPGAKS